MTSLHARIHPASRSARPVLAQVATALRGLEHVRMSSDETLTELRGLGTLVVTEAPGEILLHFSGGADVDPAAVRHAISARIRQAAGSRTSAARLVITWTDATPRLSPHAV